MSSLQIALFNTSTITHKEFASISSLQIALFESVYVSVLCCVSINFTSLFCSLLNACHPALSSPVLRSSRFNPPYAPLDNPVPSVHGSWTTCTPCSQKSHVHLLNARAALICTTASCICLPLCHSRCSCLFIQRLALRLSWTEKTVEVGANFNAPSWAIG